LATLPVIAFEGASRKNRPNLSVGALIYARVVVSNKDMSPEIVCYKANLKAEGMGELVGGYMCQCSLSLCRSLLFKTNPVLPYLCEMFSYEAAIGSNGRIWVNSGSEQHTILLINAILNSEFLNPSQIHEMAHKIKNLKN
jgi:exosome complex component RRP40